MTTGLLGHITFNELQDWLLSSGLELDVAVALDGGKSTAMYVTHPNEPVEIPAFSDLPIILAVYPR
jgi:exopolysaccharide biosynthesis protein